MRFQAWELEKSEDRDLLRRVLADAFRDAADEVVRLKAAFDSAREACFPGRSKASYVDLQSALRVADMQLHSALIILSERRGAMLEFEIEAAVAVSGEARP